ncbi:MAG: glycosyltransferase family 4 protein [Chloroflexi bacterium]|uniref:Glycosyltransferase family 4 protein n=1 Tax=Candidatus Chlorohelix allophototropha TaxID=3003348 RepID=A0A8T7M8M1_9CHLR|nr:glycosyltransferase family 4 protein [Chloroflexota bacterium]WJW68236.1 glycosyltransferase family 4 protein [Chloroflexota bacterium L227-S17]
MKICLVSPYDYTREGGVNQHIMHLAENFRVLGHTAKIIAPTSIDPEEFLHPDPDVYLVGNVVPIKANGSVARITLSLNLSSKIKQILLDEQFDVVHVHEPLMPALPLTVLLNSNAVNIGTFHAFSQSHIGYYYMRPFLRPFVNKLDGRIAVSKPALEFIRQYFRGNYEIIPNGIDLSRFEEENEPITELTDGKLNILFVGRFSERRKGLKFLLRAYNTVKMQIPNARLVIVGKGETKGYQNYLNRNGIKDVVFTGFVPDEMLPRYYRSCHVFCAPSIGGESFGIILLEAMASGLPVIASDIPGYASVLQHGLQGLLVEPRNREALALSLVHLLADSDLRSRMGDAGRARALEYTWEKVAQRVLTFYERSENRRRARIRLKRIRRATRRYYGFGWLLKRGSRPSSSYPTDSIPPREATG